MKEEKVEAEAKKAKVTSVKKKAEELPEIADYERPVLEKYEETPFTPTKKEKDKVKLLSNESNKNGYKFRNAKIAVFL